MEWDEVSGTSGGARGGEPMRNFCICHRGEGGENSMRGREKESGEEVVKVMLYLVKFLL